MGAWGTGLYSDDTTCDVRDSYVAKLKRGLSDSEARDALLREYGDSLQERDVACLVYFALAETQWRYGRLDPAVRARALTLLDEGGDLAVWERDSPRDVRARRKVLDALKQRLSSEQPARKPVKGVAEKPRRNRTDAPIGSIFLLPLPAGGFAALTLVALTDSSRWREPIFSVLTWRGDAPPTPEQLTGAALRALEIAAAPERRVYIGFMERDSRQNPLAGLLPTKTVLDPPLPWDGAVVFGHPRDHAEKVEAALLARGV